MGVEWFITCDSHYEILHLGKIRTVSEVVKEIIDGKIKEIPDWIKYLDDRQWIRDLMNNVLNFRKRHKDCEIGLLNDHGFYPDSVAYYEEVDFNKPLPNRAIYLANVRNKAPLMLHLKEDNEFELETLTPEDLWQAPDKEKAKQHLPVKDVLGEWKDESIAKDYPEQFPNGMRFTVWKLEDGRIFRTGRGSAAEFITQREFKRMKKEMKNIG